MQKQVGSFMLPVFSIPAYLDRKANFTFGTLLIGTGSNSPVNLNMYKHCGKRRAVFWKKEIANPATETSRGKRFSTLINQDD